MINIVDLLKQGRKDLIWEKYCGYLDLNIEDFMKIQRSLLMEQINLLKDCELGQKFLGKRPPKNIDEFRRKVPLTTYEDYIPYLLDKREETLPKGKYIWARTSGRSGKYKCKWIPYTRRIYDKLGEVVIGAMILSSCSYKGEVLLEPGDVVLLATAPRPYTSGYISYATRDEMDVTFVPSLDAGEKMEFGERVKEGFGQAMEKGLDFFFGLAIILGKMGEQFEQGAVNFKPSPKMLCPNTIIRLLKGFIRAKINKRKLLPSDVWNLKGVMTGGMDTDIYRKRVEHYWGKKPLEGYACTEGGMVAMQAWNNKGMTLFPDCNLYEFIPFEEHLKAKQDPDYQPKTLLLDEVEPGIYEMVFTNFLGGVMMRYRVGDLVEVIAKRDDEIGVNIPQISFYSRADDLIDIGTLARFTETTIWQAIDASGVKYVDWTARKEEENGGVVLHLYLELKKNEKRTLKKITFRIRKGLHKVCPEFADMESLLGNNNLKVTLLPANAFNSYIEIQHQAGADLAHIKPPHMQSKDEVIKCLLEEK